MIVWVNSDWIHGQALLYLKYCEDILQGEDAADDLPERWYGHYRPHIWHLLHWEIVQTPYSLYLFFWSFNIYMLPLIQERWWCDRLLRPLKIEYVALDSKVEHKSRETSRSPNLMTKMVYLPVISIWWWLINKEDTLFQSIHTHLRFNNQWQRLII